jgi:hypothetical protein
MSKIGRLPDAVVQLAAESGPMHLLAREVLAHRRFLASLTSDEMVMQTAYALYEALYEKSVDATTESWIVGTMRGEAFTVLKAVASEWEKRLDAD